MMNSDVDAYVKSTLSSPRLLLIMCFITAIEASTETNGVVGGFITLFRMMCNFKLMDYLFLEYSMYTFEPRLTIGD